MNRGHSLTSSFTKLMSFFSSRPLLEDIEEPAFGFPLPNQIYFSYQGSAFPHLNPDKFGPWAFWESEAAPSCCFLLVGPKPSAGHRGLTTDAKVPTLTVTNAQTRTGSCFHPTA